MHDVRIGDRVHVEKGGEIIPKIVGVLKDQRLPGTREFGFASVCPECGTPLVRNEDEAAHYCPNTTGCPPQIKGRIEHYISRRAMDIRAAEATIDLLYREGLVRDPADLYALRFDQLIQLERFAEKSSRNLLDSIQASKGVPFPRVLFALGIRYVGETVARKLAHAFGSIDALMDAGYDDLIAVDEIGDRIARSVLDYFADPGYRSMVERLREAGVQFQTGREEEPKGESLEGTTFVVSGVYEHHSREEIKALIEQHGGRNTGSISAKTDYVLAGDQMGPSKREKAEKLGIPIISEEEFLSMIS